MDARVQVVITALCESTADRISMWTLCRKVNLSPSRLRQLFKKETGRSPMQYRRDLRLRRAEQLLRTTFLSIKEVTFRSGMRDISHFVREFKKQYGVTPREFRARNQKVGE